MTKIKTKPWGASKYLDTPEAVEEYLLAAFETGDPKLIAASLGDVARARNMSELARECGMTRAALYRAFSGETDPGFATIMKVMRALNISIAPTVGESDKAA